MAGNGNGNGTREPSSAPRSAMSGGATAAVATGIATMLVTHYNWDPITASAAASGWGVVAGAVGKVSRDELYKLSTGAAQHGFFSQLLLTLGSVLG